VGTTYVIAVPVMRTQTHRRERTPLVINICLDMAAGKFVSDLRVSTIKQGRSGLVLEAQRAAVESFLNGGRWKIIEEFVETETESGKADDRASLQRAVCTENLIPLRARANRVS
jgi:hypothetical protein